MPASSAKHLETHSKCWDGTKYAFLPNKEAKARERKREVQIVHRNMRAGDLKRPHEFEAWRAELGTKAKTKPRKQSYQTRQMKADE